MREIFGILLLIGTYWFIANGYNNSRVRDRRKYRRLNKSPTWNEFIYYNLIIPKENIYHLYSSYFISSKLPNIKCDLPSLAITNDNRMYFTFGKYKTTTNANCHVKRFDYMDLTCSIPPKINRQARSIEFEAMNSNLIILYFSEANQVSAERLHSRLCAIISNYEFNKKSTNESKETTASQVTRVKTISSKKTITKESKLTAEEKAEKAKQRKIEREKWKKLDEAIDAPYRKLYNKLRAQEKLEKERREKEKAKSNPSNATFKKKVEIIKKANTKKTSPTKKSKVSKITTSKKALLERTDIGKKKVITKKPTTPKKTASKKAILEKKDVIKKKANTKKPTNPIKTASKKRILEKKDVVEKKATTKMPTNTSKKTP